MGLITLEKGLQEGGTISPYLFIICAKGLSLIIRDRGDINEVKIYRGAPIISHYLPMTIFIF